MKRKLLSLAAALLCSVGAWADDVTIDITSSRLINANLSSLSGWTLDDSFNADGNDYTDYKTDGDANVIEFYSEWHASPGAMETAKDFKIAQTITLTAGTYRLSAYGFYREKNGDGTNTKAFLKAGSNIQYINGLSAAGVGSYTGSSDLYKAANAFSVGDFNNTLEFTIDSKQSLEIGIVGTFNTQCSWCIVGPMSLVKVVEHGTVDLTDAIVNPSFETGDKTGWIDETTGDKMDVMLTDDLAGKDGTYWVERWWYDSTIDIHQTTPELPAGYYTITARAKAEAGNSISVYAKTGSNEPVTTSVGDENDYSVEIYLNSTNTIELGLMGKHVTQTHIAVDNFRLIYLGNPYPALSTAITTAEGHTLGFDDSEYAPYSNVTALTALADANSIYDVRTATYAEVVAATSALSDATWTANDGEVECVYNGDFAIGQDSPAADIQQYGWTRTNGWGQFHADSDKKSTSKGTSYYNQPGSLQYGNAGHYTMPLKERTIYTLTFKYASWESNSNNSVTASVLNGSDGMAAVAYGKNANVHSDEDAFVTKTIRFVTGAAGNYVLTLANSGNTVITDVSITKATNQYLEFAEDADMPTFAAGTYPEVNMTRTIRAGVWNTFCVPFDMSSSEITSQLGEDTEVKELTGATLKGDNYTLTFSTASSIVAGKPYMVKVPSDVTSISLTDKSVSSTITPTTVDGVTFTGTYTYGNAPRGSFIISNNVFYQVNSDVTLKAFRGYITVDGASVKALNFGFDDDATGISAIDNGQLTIDNAVIYNVAGQRISKLQKGINIVNGKKVLK